MYETTLIVKIQHKDYPDNKVKKDFANIIGRAVEDALTVDDLTTQISVSIPKMGTAYYTEMNNEILLGQI